MLLIDKINEKLKINDFNLDLESAVYKTKERILYFVFRYSDYLLLDKNIKDVVDETIKEELGEGVQFVVKYHKNYYDQEIIAQAVINILRKNYPMVRVEKNQISLNRERDLSKITIVVDTSFEDFLKSQEQSILEFINSGLVQEFYDRFEIGFEFRVGLIAEAKRANEDFHLEPDSSVDYEIEVETKAAFIGELIDAPIYPIAYYKLPVEGVSICGKIENLTENHTKARVDEDGKEKASREYYTFELADFSGKIRVVYFPGKANLQKFKKLENGSEIVIFGNIEEDKFQSGLSVRPKVINLMISKKGFYEKVYSMPVPKRYTRVFPEPYVETAQENLFGAFKEIENEYLLANDFVVFDLETTGVNYNLDKIIEIGAVKIVQGRMVETFGTLVNPERKIPPDATKVNNITDDDVKDAPTLKEVMPDFFKFCDGCVLVSYVIGFDFNFIEFHGKALGYAFTNKTDDAFVLAKQKLKGLKNYKLTTVAKHLGVSLENAHRAVFDAVATGEVMIKLLENF